MVWLTLVLGEWWTGRVGLGCFAAVVCGGCTVGQVCFESAHVAVRDNRGARIHDPENHTRAARTSGRVVPADQWTSGALREPYIGSPSGERKETTTPYISQVFPSLYMPLVRSSTRTTVCLFCSPSTRLSWHFRVTPRFFGLTTRRGSPTLPSLVVARFAGTGFLALSPVTRQLPARRVAHHGTIRDSAGVPRSTPGEPSRHAVVDTVAAAPLPSLELLPMTLLHYHLGRYLAADVFRMILLGDLRPSERTEIDDLILLRLTWHVGTFPLCRYLESLNL